MNKPMNYLRNYNFTLEHQQEKMLCAVLNMLHLKKLIKIVR